MNKYYHITDLLGALIQHYEKCIKEIPHEFWLFYIMKNHVHYCLCHASEVIFEQSLRNTNFIEKYKIAYYFGPSCPMPYIDELPINSLRREQVIILLRNRVAIMKAFIQTYK